MENIMKEQKPIIEGLFAWPSDDPRLLVSRCKKCGTIAFPKKSFCPNPDCEKKRENIEDIRLSKKGKVYSYTCQIYQPPAPFRMEPFEPYALGMVDFPEGLRVWGMFTRKENLKIGMEVETVAGRLYTDGDTEYMTWMWKPID
jgi:uncharacterized protein